MVGLASRSGVGWGKGVGAIQPCGKQTSERGAVAQLGEHLLCKQGVTGSIPVSSTTFGSCTGFLLERDDKKLDTESWFL